MANIIEITVKVTDKASAEAEALKSELRRTLDNEITVPVRVSDEALLEGDALEKLLRETLGRDIVVPVRIQPDDVAGSLGDSHPSGAAEPVKVPLEPDDSGFEEDVERKTRARRPPPVKVPLDPDTDEFEQQFHAAMAEAQKAADNASAAIKQSFSAIASGSRGSRAAISAEQLSQEADQYVEALEEAIKQESEHHKSEPVKVPVEPELDQGFEAEFAQAMAEADKAADSAARDIRSSFSTVESGSRTLRAAMEELEPAADGAGDALDDAGKKADSGGKKASDSGSNFSFLQSRFVLLSAAALALGPALATIPAAMGAVAAGGALMTFGLGGVISALKDYSAQSQSAGQSSAQLALTAFSNSVAIRNAEQAISDARRQAAIQAQNSADSIAQAQERLANAQQTEQQATEALNQAWKDAVNILADVNNASADAVNGVADAQLALQQAQEQATKTVSSSLSTDLQKAQALQAVTDAQQHLKDAQQRQVEAQQAADDANTRGVAGSTGVVQAQRAQAQAAQGVADAQRALVQAQRQAAESQQQSAEAIQKAVQNLSDTYEQQRLSAAAASSSGSSAANKFQQDMAGLSPAARDFVNQLISMKSGAKELSTTAQTALLPGLTQMLKDSSPLLPVFTQSLKDMGSAVGSAAIQFGALMQNPAFTGALAKVFKQGSDAAQTLGTGFVGMIGGLTQAAAGAGPIVNGLATGLSNLMVKGLPGLLGALTQNATGIGQAFQGILTLVSDLGAPLGTIAGTLVSTLAPAITILASPAMQQALQSIANLIAAILQVAGPLVTALAQGLVGALQAVNPLLQALTKFLSDNARWLTPLAAVVLGIVSAMKAWAAIQLILNAEMDANPIGALILAIAGLVAGVVYCWDHFKGFRDFVHQMLTDLHNWFFDVWHFIDGVWHAIADGTDKAWQLIKTYMINPLTDAYHFVMGKFDDLKSFIKGLPGDLAKLGTGMWDWISRGIGNVTAVVSQGFHTLINDLIEGINWAIGYVNGATHAISDAWTWIPGAGSSGIPPIDTIPLWKAAGGVAGGLSAIIGERGIELMRLPDGTQIMPHSNTASALAIGAAAAGGAVHVQLEWAGGGGDEFLTWLRKNIRIRGGAGPNSVQKVLGQSA